VTFSLFDLGFVGAAAAVNYDADAQTYITAVETADGQTLETAVKDAIDAFIVGCKADNIWNAIKASCILAGARTLNGALVPLVGTAPTNNNFVSGDYNRKTGLVGNGSTKYLDSNRTNGADPQNSGHCAIYASAGDSTASIGYYLGGGAGNGYSGLGRLATGNVYLAYISSAINSIQIAGQGSTSGFSGANRSNSTQVVVRVNQSNTTGSQTSQAPTNVKNITVFASNESSSPISYSNARLAFYSIGESLNLALLDTRVTALINAFAAAIP
jgi:hypothetical protein